MNNKIFSKLILTLFFTLGIVTETVAYEQRNLLILNGQNAEHIAYATLRTHTNSLMAALYQKAVPILVSTCLWRNFSERKHEFALRSIIPTTPEYALLTHHKELLNRLDYWTDFFKKQTNNFSDVQQLIIEQMSVEFCNQDVFKQLQDNKITEKNDELLLNFLFYLFDFDAAEWETYLVGDYYYLLVPKNYVTTMVSGTKSKVSKKYTPRESAIGLKIDHLERVEEPLDSSLVAFEPLSRKEFEFIRVLKEVIMTYDDVQEEYPYAWNIFLAGHGFNYHANYTNAGGKVEFIANLSINEFKDVLQFLNNNLKTELFIYNTCYGAGLHLHEPYTTQGKADVFNYPIIINNVSDVVSYAYIFELLLLPTLKEKKFDLDPYQFNQKTNSWKLKISCPVHWKKFFATIENCDKDHDIHKLCGDKLWQLFGPLYLETVPNIRLKGSNTFMIYQPGAIVKINNFLSLLKSSLQQPLIIDSKKNILFETTALLVPLIIKVEQEPFPIIVSVASGQAVHYLEKIEATAAFMLDILQSFWPLKFSCFKKTFLIKELACANNPESSEAMALDAKGNAIMLKNVMICVEGDYLIRIFFQNEHGKSFSCYGRYNQDQKCPTLEGLVPMNEKVVAKYLSHFESAQQEALTLYENDPEQERFKKVLEELAVVTATNS